MATYEEIYGKRVKEFDSDPTLDSSYEGQVWYNTGDGVLKSVVSFASWTSAPNMSQARRSSGGFGVQTAAVIVGGDNGAGTFFYRNVEEYNGTGFSAGTNIPEMGAPAPGNYLGLTDIGQAGTETAGVIFGGESYTRSGNHTAEYDGSSWTVTGNMNNLRRGTGCGGTQTAAFACGGYDGSNRAYTENYNGSSWTNSGAMNTAMMVANGRANLAPQTAGLVFGGSVVPGNTTRTTTEEYDGSNWATGGALNNATLNASGGGTQSAGLKFGGGPPENSTITSTENYDGSSWTTGTNMGTLRRQSAGVGSQTAALAAGGRTTTNLATAEEYNVSINTITAAAWSSGGTLNTARSQGTGAGTMTAGWVVGGQEPSLSNKTEEYDGSSWTNVNTMGMSSRLLAGAGPQTAAFATGGFVPGPSVTAALYNYDGTNWTSGAAQPVGTYGQGSLGTQTAGLAFGGSAPTTSNYLTTSYEYDGEGWTASPGSMNQGRHYIAGSGTQTAGLAAGGDKGPAKSDNTEEYNGSTWSNGATLPAVRRGAGLSGPQTSALLFGGSADPGNRVETFVYDGTAWATNPSLATSRKLIEGGSKDGTSTSAWMAGGQLESPGAVSALTEEFSGPIETATAKTLTTS